MYILDFIRVIIKILALAISNILKGLIKRGKDKLDLLSERDI